MYTTEEEYKDYFGEGEEVPKPYRRFEKIAVSQLTKYAIRFPNVDQYKELESVNKCRFTFIKDAILEQMKYMYDNPQFFEEISGTNSYTMGRISVSGPQMTQQEIERAKFSKIAIDYLEDSGIVVHSLCNPSINHCIPSCGCGVIF